MGQTHSEKIQEGLEILLKNGEITETQEENFRKNIALGFEIQEIKHFIQNPTLQNFLLQVFKSQYRVERRTELKSFKGNYRKNDFESLLKEKKQILNQRLLNFTHHLSQQWRITCKKIVDLYIKDYHNLNEQLWSIICYCLNAEELSVFESDTKFKFDSNVLKQQSKQQSQCTITVFRKSKGEEKSKNSIFGWRLSGKHKNKFVQGIVYVKDITFINFFENSKQSKLFVLLNKEFVKCYATIQDKQGGKQKKKEQFMRCCFTIMSIFLKIMEKKIVQEIKGEIEMGMKKSKILVDINEVLQTMVENVTDDILMKQQSLKIASTLLFQQNTSFLIFDQHGILELLHIPNKSDKIFQKIQKAAQSQQIQLNQLFTKNKVIKENLVKATQGLLKNQDIFECEQKLFQIKSNQKGQILQIIVKWDDLVIPFQPIPNNNMLKAQRKSAASRLQRQSFNKFNNDLEEIQKSLSTHVTVSNSTQSRSDDLKQIYYVMESNQFYKQFPEVQKKKLEQFIFQLISCIDNSGSILFTFSHSLAALNWIDIVTSAFNFNFLTPLHVFSLLLSTLAQNLTYDCTLNVIETAERSDIANLFNDILTLQNYRAKLFFEILKKEGNNFMSHLDVKTFQSFRTQMIENILSTDDESFESVSYFQPGDMEKQMQNCYRLRFLLIKCCRYCAFTQNNLQSEIWGEKLQTYLLKLNKRVQENKLKDMNVLERFENRKQFLKRNCLIPYKELIQFLQQNSDTCHNKSTISKVKIQLEELEEKIDSNVPERQLRKPQRSYYRIKLDKIR